MIFLILGILLFLCPLIVRVTIVEEGTAKIIKRFGGTVKVFIQWTGYRLSKEGEVVAEARQKRPWYGGIRMWMGTPFDKVHKYKIRWHSVEEKEGKRVPVFHEEIKDHVLLKPDRYWRKIPQMETRDGQYPDIEWLIGMRIVHPEKTIFKAPFDWIENALNELEPTLRTYVRTKKLDELLNLKSEEIWNELQAGYGYVINVVLKQEWGIQVDPNKIEIFSVSLPEEYQRALAERSRREMEAAGRAQQIIGTIIKAVAIAEGMEEEKVQEEFRKDPKEFYKDHQTIIDAVMTKLAMENNAYMKIEAEGPNTIENTLLRLIALWKGRFPSQKPPRSEREAVREEEKKQGDERLEDLQKRIERLLQDMEQFGL